MSTIKIYNDGKEIYSGDCYSNTAILKGFISGGIKKHGNDCAKFSLRLSNGKDEKTGEWRPSTYADCKAFKTKASTILENYKDGDPIWILGKYYCEKYEGKYYRGFVVRDIINIPNAQKEKPPVQKETNVVKTNDFFDDLPF